MSKLTFGQSKSYNWRRLGLVDDNGSIGQTERWMNCRPKRAVQLKLAWTGREHRLPDPGWRAHVILGTDTSCRFFSVRWFVAGSSDSVQIWGGAIGSHAAWAHPLLGFRFSQFLLLLFKLLELEQFSLPFYVRIVNGGAQSGNRALRFQQSSSIDKFNLFPDLCSI